MNDLHIDIPLKRFLLIQQCPDDWKELDLYLFRDETIAFYVGQSQLAFASVWEHLLKGSMVIPSSDVLFGLIGRNQ